MTRTIEAIYERGVLRLKEPVALADGTIVEVTITTSEPSGENKTPAEILSSIASLPMEGTAKASLEGTTIRSCTVRRLHHDRRRYERFVSVVPSDIDRTSVLSLLGSEPLLTNNKNLPTGLNLPFESPLSHGGCCFPSIRSTKPDCSMVSENHRGLV
jgi:predicted DNA-binding antitoxin AbrB/MazE fold protein